MSQADWDVRLGVYYCVVLQLQVHVQIHAGMVQQRHGFYIIYACVPSSDLLVWLQSLPRIGCDSLSNIFRDIELGGASAKCTAELIEQ